ncbi:hypothetical protein KTQ83_00795 [Holdemanella porci]|uniref:hypothetical protein n=1 Tax=Holdemanella porci TaxID=2652276 RepID=UPI001C27AF76|nr:hypothetical protein [Holdemanella porci]MBU9130877.1 hypothetical protein [Holdemanella porci]MBU9871112.1 hypothetical protein [Holdemanella porci]MBU9886091.1 hypothetical protein [Holdemanella porci]
MSIKIENEVFYSPEQLEFIIQGMRNAFNSWDKSDSERCEYKDNCDGCLRKIECDNHYISKKELILGSNDVNLMKKLAKAGTDHRKFMRMMPVYVRITAPLYWWKEFDTYKVGTVANSCSTMHKIHAEEFTLADFSIEHLDDDRSGAVSNAEWLEYLIHHLNRDRRRFIETKDKKYWWQMIQLLPSSYNQTRNIMLNYEVLANIYHSRKNHKLDEWRDFCKWIEEKVPYSWLITEIDKEGYKIIADNGVYVKC